MPRLAKTAHAAIAALVVATAATGAVTLCPGSDLRAQPVAARTMTVPVAQTRGGETGLSSALSAASDVAPLLSSRAAQPPEAVFVGADRLMPPGTAASSSFACRAAASLGWRCRLLAPDVRPGATGTAAAWAPSVDVVVVAVAARDDVTSLRRTIDRLPASWQNARTVVVGPVTWSASTGTQRRVAALRRLAVGRGAAFVDPVAQRWVTTSTRSRYFTTGGALTTAGQRYVAGRLAAALRSVDPALALR